MYEKRIETKLDREIVKRNGRALKFISPGWSGAPDRIVLMPGGRIWFVELKRPGEKPRPLQLKRIRELNDLGFQTRVVSNYEELKDFLREVMPE